MHDKSQESAFPHVAIGGHYGDNGMTLRDWFAGQALSGIVAANMNYTSWEAVAEDSYALADAMLKVRKK